MHKDLDVAKGIIIALIFGALAWGVLIYGGIYVWKNYIRPTESKVTKIFDIKEESWTHLKFR